MAKKKSRFSIYDAMDENGVFDLNPNNTSSPEYMKAEYPKMLYHPEGQRRITVAAEIITTPMGPKAVGEQSELVNQIVNNEAEELQALEEGWHLFPRDAILAGAKAKPKTQDSLEELALAQDLKIRELQKSLADMRAQMLTGTGAVGSIKTDRDAAGNKAA